MRAEIRTESTERGKRAEVVGEVDHVPERLTDTAEGKPLVLTPCFKKLYLVVGIVRPLNQRALLLPVMF